MTKHEKEDLLNVLLDLECERSGTLRTIIELLNLGFSDKGLRELFDDDQMEQAYDLIEKEQEDDED